MVNHYVQECFISNFELLLTKFVIICLFTCTLFSAHNAHKKCSPKIMNPLEGVWTLFSNMVENTVDHIVV